MFSSCLSEVRPPEFMEMLRGVISSSISLRKRTVDYIQVNVFWGAEVALPGERDMKRTWNEINTHDVPHFLLVQAFIRLNEICQNFEDHIEDS